MPTLHKLASCKIEIRFRDHLPPHVHVVMANRREALIEIESLNITGNIPLHELGEALAWVQANRVFLLAAWQRYHP